MSDIMKLWVRFSVVLLTALILVILSDDKSLYSPGELTHGHYQIELACESCHSVSFADKQDVQSACMACHQQELKQANDSHPKTKFLDPRNADYLAKIDATQCVSCHVEHKSELTHKMGVTVPQDFCLHCHEDIAEDRPSHTGMEFATCGNSGCHNFHDNRSLYEDFLLKHLDEPPVKTNPLVIKRDDEKILQQQIKLGNEALLKHEADDALLQKQIGYAQQKISAITDEWHTSMHAKVAVNCSDCHAKQKQQNIWDNQPEIEVCKDCHSYQIETFLAGKHGMRLAKGLSAMQPSEARATMKPLAAHQSLTCNSCHQAHQYNSNTAAVEACLGCHDDQHSNNYKQSKHFQLWQQEQEQQLPHGSGVSCATCHMPSKEKLVENVKKIVVNHNQNNNLRPNEKMNREVCMVCHGIQFSLDALSDQQMIKTNFLGRPSKHINSLEMVRERNK